MHNIKKLWHCSRSNEKSITFAEYIKYGLMDFFIKAITT